MKHSNPYPFHAPVNAPRSYAQHNARTSPAPRLTAEQLETLRRLGL